MCDSNECYFRFLSQKQAVCFVVMAEVLRIARQTLRVSFFFSYEYGWKEMGKRCWNLVQRSLRQFGLERKEAEDLGAPLNIHLISAGPVTLSLLISVHEVL